MKRIIRLGLLVAALLMCLPGRAAVPSYNMADAKAKATADIANWMSYLPDEVFVAHVSIPGTHDTATGEGWASSTGSTYSTTQEATIKTQLEKGVRAFDFRPGLYNGDLWCNHGTDRTVLRLTEAFDQLKEYLSAHKGEFFVMHVFRGNVHNSDSDKSTDSERTEYNNLINKIFNQDYDDMFVEYSPYLKVKDVRGKIVVFRRDRINFAYIAKAGNLENWPGDEEEWEPGKFVTASLASNSNIYGAIRATDISSPDNEAMLQRELNSIEGLYNYTRQQKTPNDAKVNPTTSYKPYWTMIFTSGAYGDPGSIFNQKLPDTSDFYRANATNTNPFFCDLINNTAQAEKGPCGIIFSDWVLTDKNGKYDAKGSNIVQTVLENNFDYINKFILDDEKFKDGEQIVYENIWEDGKWYFLRNVYSGDFLSTGENWGTHGVTSTHGIKVQPKINPLDGQYIFLTTLKKSENGCIGDNWYVDNVDKDSETLDIQYHFSVKRVGPNRFVLYNTAKDQALSIKTLDDRYKHDGTSYYVEGENLDPTNPKQQWEFFEVEAYYKEQLRTASLSNPQDIAYHVLPGARFNGNDAANDTVWQRSTTLYSQDNVELGYNQHIRAQRFYNFESAGTSSGKTGSWALNADVDLPNGLYTLKWVAYCGGISDITMKVTTSGQTYDYSSEINSNHQGPDNLKPTRTNEGSLFKPNYVNKFDNVAVGDEIANNRGKYTCVLEYFIVSDGKLTISASAPKHSSPTVVILDDFELIYYGEETSQKNYKILAAAIGDAKLRLEEIGKPNALDFSDYFTKMRNLLYNETTEIEAAEEVYQKLRKVVLEQSIGEEETDYTGAIYNASFETGTLLGWQLLANSWDTGVRPNSNLTYTISSVDRSYLFNAWDNDYGTMIYQTIPGLPAGRYKISAIAANDENYYVCFEVKGDQSVSGQRPEPIRLRDSKRVGKRIEFIFDVAENTPEVTIYFGGADIDGTWNDFGGRWYKVDDFRLVRLSDPHRCTFYERLLAAITDANRVSKETLTGTPYIDEWTVKDYQDLVDAHRNSGHALDPLSGEEYSNNGAEEVIEVYRRLRDLVLSQNKGNANMTGAISNHSFEMGDLTGWTCEAPISTDATVTDGKNTTIKVKEEVDGQEQEKEIDNKYYTAGTDVKNIFHCKNENGDLGYAIYQTIPNVPAGTYEMKVLLASKKGNTLSLGANGKYSAITIDKEGEFSQYSFKFTVDEEGSDLTIGVYPDPSKGNGEGAWYRADDFELYLIERDLTIDWTMESPSHGTIILPFDVPASELNEKGLEIYTLKTSGESSTPADPEINTYHLLTYDNVTDGGLKAFTPYVVKNVGEVKASAPRKAAASESNVREYTGATYSFAGKTSSEDYKHRAYIENSVTGTPGYLKGTLIDHVVKKEEHHLNVNVGDDFTNVGFISHDDAADDDHYETSEVIPAYHAYMTNPVKLSDGKTLVQQFYFYEPTLPIEWSMETPDFGTLVLPFTAAVPAEFSEQNQNLKVYKIDGISGERCVATQGADFPDESQWYRVLLTSELAKGDSIQKNTPYIVVRGGLSDAPSAAPRKAARKAEAEAAGHTFIGKLANDAAAYNTDLKVDPADKDAAATVTSVMKTTRVASGTTAKSMVTNDETDETGFHTLSSGDTMPSYHAYLTSAADTYPVLLADRATGDDNEVVGIEDVMSGEAGNVDVYNLDGVLLRSDIPVGEALKELSRGIYIIVCGDFSMKVIK